MFSGVLSCSDTKIRSQTAANKLKIAVCLFPEAAERAVSVLKAVQVKNFSFKTFEQRCAVMCFPSQDGGGKCY